MAATLLAALVIAPAANAERPTIKTPAEMTATASVSLDYSCNGTDCAFDASGIHRGLLLVTGILTVEGSAIPADKLSATCSGIGECPTGLAGPAAPSGCAIATATTRDSGVFTASDATYDCDPSSEALLAGTVSWLRTDRSP